MTGTNTRLTAAVEAYFADLRRIRASGGATGERSSYGPLANLLNAVGATLKPKVFCVGELADQGAGHPDFGLYAAKQVQRGRPRKGQVPERGVKVEVLKEMHGRCKRLIRLNPEAHNSWQVGDAEMRRCSAYCRQAEECNSPTHLERVVGDLLKTVQ